MRHTTDETRDIGRKRRLIDLYDEALKKGEREYCPGQYHDVANWAWSEEQRKRPWTPEQLLLVAVLQDAFACLLHPPTNIRKTRDNQDAQTARRQAEEWIDGTDESYLFSFRPLCWHLGLDPDAVRARMREKAAQAQRGRFHVVRRIGINAA